MFHEKKRMRAPHFLFSNNIAHPSSNKPSINITANIFLLLNLSDKQGNSSYTQTK
jgi:hypothetical protein